MFGFENFSKTIHRLTPATPTTYLNVFIVLAIFLMSTYVANSAPLKDKAEAMKYLTQFGYIQPAVENSRLESIVDYSGNKKAIREFQRFGGIEETGELDRKTLELMSKSRCGLKDKETSNTNDRSKRYAIENVFWLKKTLTYHISKYPRKLKMDAVDAEFARALELWSNSSDISFVADKTGRKFDIEIKFVEGAHNDKNAFDGPNNVLAHAFYPQYGGDAHFDDSENWTIDSSYGVNLLYVAVHELGHSLGLQHSKDVSSVMTPFYTGSKLNLTLGSDDILGIQEIYGNNKSKAAENIPETREDNGNDATNDNDDSALCKDPKIDTLFQSLDEYNYAFKGQMYYKSIDASETAPRKISEGWPGLPGDIDAAFTHYDNKTYFFKGTHYWRYSGHQIDGEYPMEISKGFPGVPDHLDTALAWYGNSKIYFFKGREVWLFDSIKRKVISTYPKLISSKWDGLPDNLDAATQQRNGFTIYFKGDKYYRIKNKKFKVDPGFPQPSGLILFGCDL